MIEPEEIKNLYRSYLNSYSHISELSFEKLFNVGTIKFIKANRYLVNINSKAGRLYFVAEGILASEFITKMGAKYLKNFFVPKNYASSTVSMITGAPSEFGIIALTDSTVLELDYRLYRNLILENSDLKDFYIAYLEKNWISENEIRLIDFATKTAKERYLIFLDTYPTLPLKIKQSHIASYLGITPTQLSRIRKEF